MSTYEPSKLQIAAYNRLLNSPSKKRVERTYHRLTKRSEREWLRVLCVEHAYVWYMWGYDWAQHHGRAWGKNP